MSDASIQTLGLLQLGDRGPEVTALQTALARIGLPAVASGVFDADTQRFVRGFQRVAALVPNGIVGTATRDALSAEVQAWDAAEPARQVQSLEGEGHD